MYMQIIQGKVQDAAKARATLDRWLTDLKPGAKGWLGGTYGVADDGTLIGCVRFTDHASADANAARPEQTAWWQEMEQHFSGPVTFHDCDDVTLLLGGGSDDASFVQVIQAKVSDPQRFKQLMESSSELLSQYRPDVLGASIAIDADGLVTETIAFTSEEAARRAEKQEMPAEAAEVMSMLQDPTFLDLHEPWFASAQTR